MIVTHIRYAVHMQLLYFTSDPLPIILLTLYLYCCTVLPKAYRLQWRRGHATQCMDIRNAKESAIAYTAQDLRVYKLHASGACKRAVTRVSPYPSARSAATI